MPDARVLRAPNNAVTLELRSEEMNDCGTNDYSRETMRKDIGKYPEMLCNRVVSLQQNPVKPYLRTWAALYPDEESTAFMYFYTHKTDKKYIQ